MIGTLWFAHLLLLGAAPSAVAAGPHAHEVSFAVSTLQYTSYLRPGPALAVFEARYRQAVGAHGIAQSLFLAGGLRAGTERFAVRLPLEGFVQAELAGRIGFWESAVGFEGGVGGFGQLPERFLPALIEDTIEQSRVSPFFLGIEAAPLRFRYQRATVSVFEVHVALASFRNTVQRSQLVFLRMGFDL